MLRVMQCTHTQEIQVHTLELGAGLISTESHPPNQSQLDVSFSTPDTLVHSIIITLGNRADLTQVGMACSGPILGT